MDHQINESVGPELPQSAHPAVTPLKFQNSQKRKNKKEEKQIVRLWQERARQLKLSLKKNQKNKPSFCHFGKVLKFHFPSCLLDAAAELWVEANFRISEF